MTKTRPKLTSTLAFPNAAVDRIVPIQHNEDPLFVSVEDFKEWVIDESQMKNPKIRLEAFTTLQTLNHTSKESCSQSILVTPLVLIPVRLWAMKRLGKPLRMTGSLTR